MKCLAGIRQSAQNEAASCASNVTPAEPQPQNGRAKLRSRVAVAEINDIVTDVLSAFGAEGDGIPLRKRKRSTESIVENGTGRHKEAQHKTTRAKLMPRDVRGQSTIDALSEVDATMERKPVESVPSVFELQVGTTAADEQAASAQSARAPSPQDQNKAASLKAEKMEAKAQRTRRGSIGGA
jgi:hypothetical protein